MPARSPLPPDPPPTPCPRHATVPSRCTPPPSPLAQPHRPPPDPSSPSLLSVCRPPLPLRLLHRVLGTPPPPPRRQGPSLESISPSRSPSSCPLLSVSPLRPPPSPSSPTPAPRAPHPAPRLRTPSSPRPLPPRRSPHRCHPRRAEKAATILPARVPGPSAASQPPLSYPRIHCICSSHRLYLDASLVTSLPCAAIPRSTCCPTRARRCRRCLPLHKPPVRPLGAIALLACSCLPDSPSASSPISSFQLIEIYSLRILSQL
ncbi:hypothetical protein GQ55_4G185100 [Panicum hallii var. hallii]|uniref:Uncharacterized protein n=1 Tax=Panicum hallii var. hallii TaxID=1504633 RepID=A0A2T7DYX7_9POAL|nr:hypothetical protein GQ55_4G185100 [Panicum hallii var. hallii]